MTLEYVLKPNAKFTTFTTYVTRHAQKDIWQPNTSPLQTAYLDAYWIEIFKSLRYSKEVFKKHNEFNGENS